MVVPRATTPNAATQKAETAGSVPQKTEASKDSYLGVLTSQETETRYLVVG